MPSLAPVAKSAKVAVIQTLGENIDVLNRFFLNWSGTDPTPTQWQTFLTDLAAQWVTHMFANLSHELVGKEVTGTVLTSPTSPEVTVPLTGAGASVTPSVPAGTALVLQFPIARRYRGGHPRMYIAGAPDDQLTDPQTWSSVITAALAADWAAFIAAIPGIGWTGGGSFNQVNISYFAGFTNHMYPSGRVKPIPTPRVTPVLDFCGVASVNPKVASQRRRNLQSR